MIKYWITSGGLIDGRLEEVSYGMPSERIKYLWWTTIDRECIPDGWYCYVETTGTGFSTNLKVV